MAKKQSTTEEIFSAYAEQAEQQAVQNTANLSDDARTKVYEDMARRGNMQKPMTTEEAREALRAETGGNIDKLGWHRHDISFLPSRGIFYPEGTVIRFRAARGEEIKHWSTMDEGDIQAALNNDDLLNYIVERCIKIEYPDTVKDSAGRKVNASWKDFADIDRLYLIFLVRDITFVDRENVFKTKVDANHEIEVDHNMIAQIDLPEELMKFYSPEARCFGFKTQDGHEFRLSLPSLGVNQWIKNYMIDKSQNRERIDSDFILYAPFLIQDWRDLMRNPKMYDSLLGQSSTWTVQEWSILAYLKDVILGISEPMINYIDEQGAEVKKPLTFPNGLRSLFIIPNPLQGLDILRN